MLRQTLRKARYTILLLQIGGLSIFIRKFRRQLYSRVISICLEKNLDSGIATVPSRIDYSLQLATKEAMAEILQSARLESQQSVCELIKRKLFYESGFHNCYVGRTSNGGGLWYRQWSVFPEKESPQRRGFRD